MGELINEMLQTIRVFYYKEFLNTISANPIVIQSIDILIEVLLTENGNEYSMAVRAYTNAINSESMEIKAQIGEWFTTHE